ALRAGLSYTRHRPGCSLLRSSNSNGRTPLVRDGLVTYRAPWRPVALTCLYDHASVDGPEPRPARGECAWNVPAASRRARPRRTSSWAAARVWRQPAATAATMYRLAPGSVTSAVRRGRPRVLAGRAVAGAAFRGAVRDAAQSAGCHLFRSEALV